MEKVKRSEFIFVTEEMLKYLDKLRESGEINMYGAAPYVAEAFSLGRREAIEVVKHWMATFEERHPV